MEKYLQPGDEEGSGNTMFQFSKTLWDNLLSQVNQICFHIFTSLFLQKHFPLLVKSKSKDVTDREGDDMSWSLSRPITIDDSVANISYTKTPDNKYRPVLVSLLFHFFQCRKIFVDMEGLFWY